ncbi:MAG: DUF421 domain-containing protein [Jatrophihabitantaceae bacterium]
MQIVVRALVVFTVLFLITRVVGKRQLGQMTAFELVLLITMGDLVQQGVTQEDYSMTGAFLAVATFAAASIALSWVTWKFKRARRLIDGHPTVIIREGKMLTDVADLERLPVDEIFEAMREKGIRDPADVDLGVLELYGGYSFSTRAAGS